MDPATESLEWLTLEEGEEVLWSDTPHQLSLVPAFAVGIPLSLVLVGIPIVVAAYLNYVNTNYVVTTEALYRKTGILSRDVQRITFEKVQNTSYRQSAIGATLGYGTVEVSTAGGSGVELSFTSVADPLSVQQRINGRIRDRRDDGGETREKTAVLDDILDELRAIRVAVEGDERPPGGRRDHPTARDPASTEDQGGPAQAETDDAHR